MTFVERPPSTERFWYVDQDGNSVYVDLSNQDSFKQIKYNNIEGIKRVSYLDPITETNYLIHRDELDGPAMELSGEHLVWYKNGVVHREDGPAIVADNINHYYWKGQPIIKSLHEDLTKYLPNRTQPPLPVEPTNKIFYIGEDGEISSINIGRKAFATDITFLDIKLKIKIKDKYFTIHNNNDQPAIIRTNDEKNWVVDGKYHRDVGPAVIWRDHQYYYLDGIMLSNKAEYDRKLIDKNYKHGMLEKHNRVFYKKPDQQIEYIDLPSEMGSWSTNFTPYEKILNVKIGSEQYPVHNENGRPGIIFADGQETYYKDGLAHREDGPAITRAGGKIHKYDYYLNDQCMNIEQHAVAVRALTHDTVYYKDADGKVASIQLHNADMNKICKYRILKNIIVVNEVEYVIHRDEKDGPAIIRYNGIKQWVKDGYLHRLDGPAAIHKDSVSYYYIEGCCLDQDAHSRIVKTIIEKPEAVTPKPKKPEEVKFISIYYKNTDGSTNNLVVNKYHIQEYVVDHKDGISYVKIGGEVFSIHRDETNGPAIIYPDGTKIWYKNGMKHREGGAAMEYSETSIEGMYYLDGKSCSKEQHSNIMEAKRTKAIEAQQNISTEATNETLKRIYKSISYLKNGKIETIDFSKIKNEKIEISLTAKNSIIKIDNIEYPISGNGDTPAVAYANGCLIWVMDGVWHRNNGPASWRMGETHQIVGFFIDGDSHTTDSYYKKMGAKALNDGDEIQIADDKNNNLWPKQLIGKKVIVKKNKKWDCAYVEMQDTSYAGDWLLYDNYPFTFISSAKPTDTNIEDRTEQTNVKPDEDKSYTVWYLKDGNTFYKNVDREEYNSNSTNKENRIKYDHNCDKWFIKIDNDYFPIHRDHRVGPAIIGTNYSNNSEYVYMTDGGYHNNYGPAVIIENGNKDVVSKVYYLNNKCMTKQDWEKALQKNTLAPKSIAAVDRLHTVHYLKDGKVWFIYLTDDEYNKNIIIDKDGKWNVKIDEKQFLIHNLDGPAIINTCPSGEQDLIYMADGLYHREDGPALIFNTDKYNKRKSYWLKGNCIKSASEWENAINKIRSDNKPGKITITATQKPWCVCYLKDGGVENILLTQEEYNAIPSAADTVYITINNKKYLVHRHQNFGPAISGPEYNIYVSNGKWHRTSGPAFESKTDVRSNLYYTNGKVCSKEDAENLVVNRLVDQNKEETSIKQPLPERATEPVQETGWALAMGAIFAAGLTAVMTSKKTMPAVERNEQKHKEEYCYSK